MEEIKVNGQPCVISVSHVTEPGEGWQGSILIAECKNMKEVNSIINNFKNKPDPYWQWKIEFQDKITEEDG